MGDRPYRRPLMQPLTELSRPLLAAVALGVLSALVVVTVWVVQAIGDYDVDFLGPILFALVVAAVICVGVELNNRENMWVRAVGVTLVVGTVLLVVALLLTFWFLAQLCENGCN